MLVRLAESDYITSRHILVDYGCGKGRVGFFLQSVLGCSVIGIEYNEALYRQVLQNRKLSTQHPAPEFLCVNAKNFQINDADCFYFFNPFSVEILRTVVGQR